jgi:hypothetical protein
MIGVISFMEAASEMKLRSFRLSQIKTLLGGVILICLWFALLNLIIRITAVHATDYQARIGQDVEAQLAFS